MCVCEYVHVFVNTYLGKFIYVCVCVIQYNNIQYLYSAISLKQLKSMLHINKVDQ